MNRQVSSKLLSALLLLLLPSLTATAQETTSPWQHYSPFKEARCYRIMDAGILLAGTAEELFTEHEIRDKLQLALKQAMGEFPSCRGGARPDDLGIMLKIWTVGEEYPITCNVDLEAIPVDGRDYDPDYRYQTSIHGYNDREILIRDGIDKYLRTVAKSLAADFLSARDGG